jgi:hypothetical protein
MKSTSLFTALTSLFILLFLAGCGSGSRLVGTWGTTSGSQFVALKPGGALEIASADTGGTVQTGTWEQNDNILTFTINGRPIRYSLEIGEDGKDIWLQQEGTFGAQTRFHRVPGR